MSNALAVLDAAPTATMEQIDAVEAIILAYPQIEITPVHRFAKGVYAREITMPADTLITGHLHTTQHLVILSEGRVTVYSPGEPVRHLTAPCTFISEPGTRRLIYAHEHAVWTTIHGTDETDIDRLEATLIAPHINPFVLLPEASAWRSLPQE